MKLYGYYRSSTSYRVRIALALKNLTPDLIPVNLLKTEQRTPQYRALNPEMRVPTLIDGEHVLTQSLAIMEYLEEKYPSPALLPTSPEERARVRALALAVACDIAPLGNLGPTRYLQDKLGITDEQKNEWIRHWIHRGFEAVEAMLSNSSYTGSFCHGSQPGLADCCLVPQIYNARRFGCDLRAFPHITSIGDRCAAHPAFIQARPENQPDFISTVA
ncbi:MAG: maleylacetoacetate isomerase [Rickettsiales bacterium]|nr:maleylacetoacetate isomerase [Rickettsiales bacterium]